MGTSPKLQMQPEVQLQPAASEAPVEQRLYLRKRVVKPLPIELLPGKGVWLYDIGEGGLSVSGTSRLQPGANTFLNFQFPEANTLIDAAGIVAWCDDSGRAGVRFTRIKPDSTAALKRWLKTDSSATVTAAGGTPDSGQPSEEREQSLAEVELLKSLIANQKLDKGSALQMIAELMAELTRASGAAIALLEGADVICRACVGNAPAVGVKLSLDSKLSGECFLTGNIVQLNDSENDPRVDPEVCRALNFRSVLIIPVFSFSQVVGICEVLSPQPTNFQGGDVLVVSALAELVASSLDAPERIDAATEALEDAGIEQADDLPASVLDQQSTFDDIMALVASDPIAQGEPLPAIEQFQSAFEEAQPAIEEPQATAEDPEWPLPDFPELEKAVPLAVAEPAFARTEPAAMPIAPRKAEPKAKPKQEISTSLVVVLSAIFILLTGGVVEYIHLSRTRQLPPATTTAPSSPANANAPGPVTAAPETVNPSAETTPAKTTETASAKSASAKPAKSAKTEKGSESDPEEVTVITPSERRALATSRTESTAPAAPNIASLSASSSAPAIPLPAISAPKLVGVVNVSNGVSGGKLIHRVAPSYPDLAKRAGVSGTVVLSAVVAKDGSVTKLKLVKGSQLLAAEAIRAASQWKYSPFVLDGKPIEVETQIVMDFKR